MPHPYSHIPLTYSRILPPLCMQPGRVLYYEGDSPHPSRPSDLPLPSMSSRHRQDAYLRVSPLYSLLALPCTALKGGRSPRPQHPSPAPCSLTGTAISQEHPYAPSPSCRHLDRSYQLLMGGKTGRRAPLSCSPHCQANKMGETQRGSKLITGCSHTIFSRPIR